MKFRGLITGTVFVILLIWGPINHSWPAWLFIRLAYLIIIPIAVSFLLKWIWNYWEPNTQNEDIAEKVASGIICLGLWTLAVLEVIAKTHIGNTHWIQTRDGMEAVGDDIVLPGPDWWNVLLLAAVSFCVLWFGIIKKTPVTKD
jgi:hypothetical protein